MRSVDRRRFALVPVLAAAAWSCGGGDGDLKGPLVEVDGRGIDAAQLRDYRARLPQSLQPAGESGANIRSLLQSLADGRLMIAEAEAKGYHRDPEFVGRQRDLLTRQLVDMVVRRQVGPNVSVTDEDVQKVYRDYHWDREVLPGHILSATEAEAREVIRLLDGGRDFAELAKERSIAADAARGGFLGQYFGPNDAVEELVMAAHGLPIGEHTRTPVRTRDGWEVVKVLDATPVPLERVRPQLERGIYLGKFADQRRQFVAALAAKHGVTYDVRAIDALVRAARAGQDPSAADGQQVAVRFGGDHSLRVADLQRFVVGDPRLAKADSLQVVAAITTRVLADSLMVLEARAAGLDTTAEYTEFRTSLYERMLVTFLRKREVLESIAISEDEVRASYDGMRADLRIPDEVALREIVVADRRQADAVAARLRRGEDAKALAASLSLRPTAARDEGHAHVTEADREKWGEAFEAIWTAAEGDVLGPLPVPEGFWVAQAERVRKGLYRTFEEMRLGLTHRLKLSRQYAAFEAYVADLRRRYEGRVVWHDDRIAALAKDPEWSRAPGPG